VSALAAVSFQAWYSALSHPYLAWALLVAPAAAYVAGRRAPAATAGVVFATGYLLPTLLIRITGIHGAYQSVWTASLLAALAGTIQPGWQVPSRYRFALVAWGLAVAATWPLIAFREFDWTPQLMLAAPPNRNPAMYAADTALFIAGIAQTHLVGIIWLDWLAGTFSRRTIASFERRIIGPLMVAAAVAAALAVYQGFIDLEYPRQSLWAHIGRASGALDDANASGALGALWVAVPIALAFGRPLLTALPAWTLSAFMLVGIWQTGSRTATFGAAVALGGVVHVLFVRSVHRVQLAALLTALALAATFVGPVFFRAPTSNPMSRMREFQQTFNSGGLVEVGRELFRRNGYGPAATRMILDEPAQGIGVGSFPALSGEYAKLVSGQALPVDNAQNWWRHQIAELGAIGAIGPLLWTWFVVVALASRPAAGSNPDRLTVLKYTIVAFGIISMVGMPSQNLFVAMTMWTLCAWLLLSVDSADRFKTQTGRWVYVVAALMAAVLAVLTYESGWHELRPPFRAKRFDYPYTAGLYAPMDGPMGTTVTSRNAVVVQRAQTGVMKLDVWVEHPDADSRPVRVEAWIDGERVIRGRFAKSVPLTRFVAVPAGERFVLETRVDRTFAAPERHQPEVGLNITWHFVDSAAP